MSASSSRLPSPEEVRQRLDDFHSRRGYLLPHQGAMAAALPDLQDVYGVVYKILTLDPHHLDAFEREFVWLALLIAARERVGTHHVDLFFRTGGTDEQADAAFRLAAWAQGSAAYEFLARDWQAYFPASPADSSYIEGVKDLLRTRPDIAPGLARLALAACHAALGHHWPLRVVLRDCYELGVPEAKIAETLSLVLWPCGVNRFLEASDVWLDLMRSGQVRPSPAFQAWADTPGQDGFQFAARTGPGHTG